MQILNAFISHMSRQTESEFYFIRSQFFFRADLNMAANKKRSRVVFQVALDSEVFNL